MSVRECHMTTPNETMGYKPWEKTERRIDTLKDKIRLYMTVSVTRGGMN